MGDINGDDIVNVLDVIATVNIILGLSDYDTQADMNNDNIINVLDVIQVVNIILN